MVQSDDVLLSFVLSFPLELKSFDLLFGRGEKKVIKSLSHIPEGQFTILLSFEGSPRNNSHNLARAPNTWTIAGFRGFIEKTSMNIHLFGWT